MTGAFNIAASVKLLDVGTVRAVLGRTGDDVIGMIEDGQWLRHAFDLSAGSGHRAAYRVSRCCLLAWTRQAACEWTQAAVVDMAIGVERRRLRGAELVIGWMLTRPHLVDLIASGHLLGENVEHTAWIDRESAISFLNRRAIGTGEALGDFKATTLKSSCNGHAKPWLRRNENRPATDGSQRRPPINDFTKPASERAKTGVSTPNAEVADA